jgi:hypothetical protein
MNELFKDLFYLLLLFVLTWCGFYLFTRHDTIEQRVTRYNCDLSEFVARIPDDIRAECRRQKIIQLNTVKE